MSDNRIIECMERAQYLLGNLMAVKPGEEVLIVVDPQTDERMTQAMAVPNGDSYEVYEKTAYEANGGGLLFRILAFEDTHYRDLNGCTILGFCGNKIFILDPHYDEQYASDSEEYTQCKEIVTSIKKSFISYIKDAGTVE